MRRATPGVVNAAELAADRISDPDRVIHVLEPLVLERRRERLREILSRRLESVRVVFDAPYDPHNGAAVVRSAEAFGVQHVHVVERVKPFLAAREVARGAQKWVDVHAHATASDAIAAMRAARIELVGAHPDGELEPEQLAGVGRLALVLGNERDGISEELLAACSRRVRVPMRGFIESLNVSVTAAILLFAATRGRQGDLDESTRRRLYALGLFTSLARAQEILDASR